MTKRKNFVIKLQNGKNVFFDLEPKKYIVTDEFIYLLSNHLYEYNIYTREMKTILNEYTSFDVSDNKMAVGEKNGRITVIYKNKLFFYHWHDSKVFSVKFSKRGDYIYSCSCKNILHIYDLNINQFRLIFAQSEIKEIYIKENIVELRNDYSTFFYDPKLEKMTENFVNLKDYFIIERFEEKTYKEYKKRLMEIRTRGIYQKEKETNNTKRVMLKKRELIYKTDNYIVFYDLATKKYNSIYYKCEKLFVNNFLITKDKDIVKIHDYKFNLIFEIQMRNEKYKNIFFFDQKIYFLKDNGLYQQKLSCRKLIYDQVLEVFYYIDDVFIIQKDGIRNISGDKTMFDHKNIKSYKVIKDILMIYDGNNLFIYDKYKLINKLEINDLIDFDYENYLVILLKQKENKRFLCIHKEEIEVPADTKKILNNRFLLLESGKVYEIE